MVYRHGGFILFGGYDYSSGSKLSTIARFDEATRKWSKLGDLLTARSSHGAVYIPDRRVFLVVGGHYSELATEECQINGASITCSSRSPKLINYFRWPAFFLVDDTFNQ